LSRPQASEMEDSRGTLVGIDVSLELSSVCVVDGWGKIVKEAKVASEPEALVYFSRNLAFQ
jgi:transposase